MLHTRLRLGTRASLLARWQADWVTARLRQQGIDVELLPVVTSGDQQQMPIGADDERGVFTKEIQRELLAGRIDLAVHSLKDLPTDDVPGLVLAAVPERAPAGDVLVCAQYPSLGALPPGATVGTGSLRRRAQLLNVRPDLQMRDIRGNVDTRLRKLRQGDYDAIILAEAGLRRLDLAEQITECLPLELFLPAVGQGALGVETRRDDPETREAVALLDDPAARQAVMAERAMLAALRGGCLAPIAAWGRAEGSQLTLTGRVLSFDGVRKIEVTQSASPAEPEPLGRRVAAGLIAQGAVELIAAARHKGQ
jgi:hydroxymethylbilane synthase